MCYLSSVQESAVRDVMGELISKSEIFSAFDITTLVRNQGVSVPHMGKTGVRKYVHELYFSMDDFLSATGEEYSRSLHDFGKGNVWVFHPISANVDDYDPTKFQNYNVSTVSTQSVTDPVVATDTRIATDKRGRLCIPASMLRSLHLGRHCNTNAVVFLDGQEIHILNASSTVPGPNDKLITYYKPDKSSNIRISRRVLRKLYDAHKYHVTVDNCNDKIVITV